MRRREFIAGLTLALTAHPAWAQSPQRAYRIALPITTLKASDADGLARDPFYGPFRKQLARLGWIEDKTVELEWWSAEGNFGRFGEIAAQVVSTKPDIISLSSVDFAGCH